MSKGIEFPVIGVMVSGRGSNLEALIRAIEANELHARIGLVISSKAGVRALEIAKQANIATQVISPKNYPSRRIEGEAIIAAMQAIDAQLIVTAGYARIFDSCVVEAFRWRIVNIHPALLPAFAGLMAPGPQAKAIEGGVKVAGCTTHFVTEATDAGPIIAQACVPVLDNDTIDTLSQRILEQEHCLLPQSVEWILQGRIQEVVDLYEAAFAYQG